ncbi:Kae1-associated kinase Bud32 [Verruconis gallopava]|uniref:EKC/KEOPS complex subunit BUD32 n=1 Tax=Verruconis gallopava TaxID=253628 RepID=A0A0D2AW71_9PEZI|nr:Kae1-associated kinase Bud32 [Verruconis gallopava]KIW03409.1 Kae1-associated kinase Bud32 [Verruconis gallopava]
MATATSTPSLPPPFDRTLPEELELITQGAEARLYRTPFLTRTQHCALKYRPRKTYRHPTLDARLTKQRILAEARVLVRCRKEGLRVPAVLGVDWEEGWLGMEWITGRTVRQCLDEVLKDCHSAEEVESNSAIWELMGKVGKTVGKLHEIGVVHGDLTTSNLMVRNEESAEQAAAQNLRGEIVIIDFGLALQTVQDEDRAVDLYVLERAFGSTHPQAEGLFKEVLRVYGESYKSAKSVLRRLDDVRLRGRKKSMIG